MKMTTKELRTMIETAASLLGWEEVVVRESYGQITIFFSVPCHDGFITWMIEFARCCPAQATVTKQWALQDARGAEKEYFPVHVNKALSWVGLNVNV